MKNFIARNRINVSRASFLVVIAMILFTSPIWEQRGWFNFILEALGYILIIVAVFGRLWSSIFICGYKTKKVIQHGPYSVTRNPLYVFSFLGAIGIGMVVGSLVTTAVIIFIFVFIYARTVIYEESKLEDVLGVEYLQYKANTPRFFPNLGLYKTLPEYTIKLRTFEQAFKDAVWFLLGYGLLKLIGILHESGALPVLIHLP